MLDGYLKLDQAAVAAGYRSERARLRGQVVAMSEAQLGTESLCAGWRVRDVIAHMTGLVADILAGNVDGAGTPDATAAQVATRAGVFCPDALLVVRTGHVELIMGDEREHAEGSTAHEIVADPVLLALVAFDRLTRDEARALGRCEIPDSVPDDVVGIFGPPVAGSTMLSPPVDE